MSTKESVLALLVVIETNVLRPTEGGVALVAGLVELRLVKIVVAVGARGIDGPKVALLVTCTALYALVLTLEFEPTETVVEKADAPLLEAPMAPIAAHISKLTPVQIRMAERAIGRGVVLDLGSVGMTPKARLVHVLPFEGKACDPVVEARLLPAFR